jgi:hypothetical protein
MNICLFYFGWKKLPSYPHPILAPGVVVVIGGYDIIAGKNIKIDVIFFLN